MNSRMMISIAGITIFFGLLLVLLPDFGSVSEERMTSASMTMCIGKIRAGVKSDLLQGKPVKTDYEVKCPKLISRMQVHSNGSIEVYNPTHKIQLSFQPSVNEGKLSWSCKGEPAEHVPANCRKEKVREGQ